MSNFVPWSDPTSSSFALFPDLIGGVFKLNFLFLGKISPSNVLLYPVSRRSLKFSKILTLFLSQF